VIHRVAATSRRAAVAVLLGVVALATPRLGDAQPPLKVPRVGVIGERSASDPFLGAFRQSLHELGYTEGKGIVLEYRYADGRLDRVRGFAAELVGLGVDVLVVGGAASAQSAKAATATVPIVFATVGDPVQSGLVASLARPCGKATGLSTFGSELAGKQVELLKETVAKLSRVTVLYNPDNPNVAPGALRSAREAGRALGIEVRGLEARRRGDLASAISPLTPRGAGALLVIGDPVFGNELPELSRLAAARRLPAIYVRREFAELGGLLSYGPSFSENWRRAAIYVDKILKGAKPADLPVEQPTKFEMAINLKTASALGLAVPPSVVSRADQVIR
jgi:putative ABC transport system substrate-binding protein